MSKGIDREPLSLRRAIEVLAVVADALHYVHTAKLVHRDIKPSNILLGLDGRVYVADFGLATRESNPDTAFAHAGTMGYMSPEQARGEAHLMDGRSDQFSLGCVMYELLTGCRPFSGATNQETRNRLLHDDPKPLRDLNPGIPRELNRICIKLLAKFGSSDGSVRRIQDGGFFEAWLQCPMSI